MTREAKAFSWIACAFLAGMIAMPQSARAATLTENPTQDVEVLGAAANTNYGTSSILSVYNDTGGGNVQQSFLQFDLNSIPVGSTINSATLTLTHDDSLNGGNDNGLNTNVFRVTASWNQSQATWNVSTTGNLWSTAGGSFVGTTGAQNASPYASSRYAGPPYPPIYTVNFDVTTLIGQWVAGTYANDGFAISAPNGNRMVYASTNFGSSSEWPVLVVNYTTVPEPSTALLMIGAVALLGVISFRARISKLGSGNKNSVV